MHILLIVSWYKTPENPIAGSFFEEQARMLLNAGNRVGVLFPEIDMQFSMRFKRGKEQPNDFIDNDIPTFYSYCKSIVPRSKQINFYYVAIKAEKKFRQYIKKYGVPDILHAHSTYYGGVVAAYLSRKFGIPFVLTEHYSGLLTSSEWMMPSCMDQMQKVFKKSSCNIVVSNYFKKELIARYSIEETGVHILPNLVNSIFFETKPIDLRAPFSFCIIGALVPIKNHELLFHAFKEVLQFQNCILHVVGDGELKFKLKELVNTLSIEKNVIFHGRIERENVRDIVGVSHVIVSSSKYETFGVNIIEALAAGRPVVATDSGGPRDIINSQNGILVKEHSKKSLSEALLKMIKDYDSYDKFQISKRCREQFSAEVILKQLLKIYKKVKSLTVLP